MHISTTDRAVEDSVGVMLASASAVTEEDPLRRTVHREAAVTLSADRLVVSSGDSRPTDIRSSARVAAAGTKTAATRVEDMGDTDQAGATAEG